MTGDWRKTELRPSVMRRNSELPKWNGESKRRAPLPLCFLQEYDSMGVRGWGCAKNMILKGIAASREWRSALQALIFDAAAQRKADLFPTGSEPSVRKGRNLSDTAGTFGRSLRWG